ncbi:transcription termination factor [Wolffia australiana]
MLQFPVFMGQYPTPPLIPSSVLLPVWSSAQNDEILLAMEESELEDRLNEIRKANSDLVVVGKTAFDYKEDLDAEADDDDADNIDESDGDDFEQEAA